MDPAIVWQRIESFIAWRWSARDVVWIVEGCGEWHPPLTPVTINTVEIWAGVDEWIEATDLSPSPYGGYFLPSPGPYRITGIAGNDDADVPEVVAEAVKRLSAYMAARPGTAGAYRTSVEIGGGGISETIARDEAWQARAIPNSGAGDLLRPYRRVS
jgi:hypothetical protein